MTSRSCRQDTAESDNKTGSLPRQSTKRRHPFLSTKHLTNNHRICHRISSPPTIHCDHIFNSRSSLSYPDEYLTTPHSTR